METVSEADTVVAGTGMMSDGVVSVADALVASSEVTAASDGTAGEDETAGEAAADSATAEVSEGAEEAPTWADAAITPDDVGAESVVELGPSDARTVADTLSSVA
jgi:hypothetical protein